MDWGQTQFVDSFVQGTYFGFLSVNSFGVRCGTASVNDESMVAVVSRVHGD